MKGPALLFEGGSIAGEEGLVEGGLLVVDGKVAGRGAIQDVPEGTRTIDCRGKVVLPGMFDVNVHLREPGREDKESIRSGTEAAINGGVTGLVAMPDTNPTIDSGGLVQAVLDIASREARIPVFTSGCITRGGEGEELANIGDMVRQGVKMITDDASPVPNPQVLRRAMEYARDLGIMLTSHCETPDLSANGAMNEGSVSYRTGIPGIPASSEEICIARDIRLAQMTGARLHIQQVSTWRGMEIIKRFKNEGVEVSCEISPHHLILNETDIIDYDTHFKMNPPLRTAEDNERLLEGLVEGVFDVIATDHSPHTRFEKLRDFGSAPFGITGLETALPSIYHYLIKEGRLGWEVVVKCFAQNPRKLVGLDPLLLGEGEPAEVVVFDPEGETCFEEFFFRSKGRNSPFLGKTLSGRVETVVVGEEMLLDRNESKEAEA